MTSSRRPVHQQAPVGGRLRARQSRPVRIVLQSSSRPPHRGQLPSMSTITGCFDASERSCFSRYSAGPSSPDPSVRRKGRRDTPGPPGRPGDSRRTCCHDRRKTAAAPTSSFTSAAPIGTPAASAFPTDTRSGCSLTQIAGFMFPIVLPWCLILTLVAHSGSEVLKAAMSMTEADSGRRRCLELRFCTMKSGRPTPCV